jgi:signal transduction histidine kinase
MKKSPNKVLIVDDNLKNLQITGKILKDQGYIISVASSGPLALIQLDEFSPDLILLDIMMPDMSGFEVIAKIKENSKFDDVPVIFLTAKNQVEDLISCFEAGAVDFITKPFIKEELMMRVKTHLDLFWSKKQIVEMNATRDKLYSIIAHDIRAPFGGIIQTLNLITEGVVKSNSPFFMEMINLLSKRSSNTFALLNNLLEWTKLKSNKIPITPKLLNLSTIAQYNIQLLNNLARSKDIEIKLEIDSNIDAFVDELSLNTIFRNLLSNAIKFTPNNGLINIFAFQETRSTTIVFADNGIGISEEDINRIFVEDKYHSTCDSGNVQGSGLGLFLVKDFTEINNGSIKVESIINKGTNIFVTLPNSNRIKK